MLGELNLEHIKKTAIILGIPADFVRKDYFVTKAIQILTSIEDEYFMLVFQGGTSLSKGYHIVSRLSEDIDFRVVVKPAAITLGKDNRRKKLRDFRYALINALKNSGFTITEDQIEVLYEGKYMHIQAGYENSETVTYLKPHIMIECFLGEISLPTDTREITSLTKFVLKDECAHTSTSVTCIALDETAAEKWVGLTRRIANTQVKQSINDKHLVRHIYDLYHLNISGLLTGSYCDIVAKTIEKDKKQFRRQNHSYTDNPIRASEAALDSIFQDLQWRAHWEYFLNQMVYEKDKPSFDKAYEQLRQLSKEVLHVLKTQHN